MSNQKEKRESKRVPFKVKVDYQYQGNFLFESAVDISRNGIFIESTDPKPLGTRVTLQFDVPESKKRLELAGEVLWVNSAKSGSKNPGMGIRFSQLSETDKEILTNLVRRLAVL